MKLKEKLAKEYANRESTCPMNDFLAGFEKAREMAKDFLIGSWNHPKYLGRSYSKALEMIGDDIRAIGEEAWKPLP